MDNELSMLVQIDIKASASLIKGQMESLKNALKGTKIEIEAQLDMKNVSQELKTELDKAQQQAKKFKSQYEAVMKSVGDKPIIGEKGTEQSKQNLKELGTNVEKLESQIRDFARTSGGDGKGVFSFTETRDGVGNLKAVETVLKNVDGTVQKMQHNINETGKLELFKTTHLDKTQAQFEKVNATISKIQNEAERTGNEMESFNRQALVTSGTLGKMNDKQAFKNIAIDLKNGNISIEQANAKMKEYKATNDGLVSTEAKRVVSIQKIDNAMKQLNTTSSNDRAVKNMLEQSKSMILVAKDSKEMGLAIGQANKAMVAFDHNKMTNGLQDMEKKIRSNVDEIKRLGKEIGQAGFEGSPELVSDIKDLSNGVEMSTQRMKDILERSKDEVKAITKEYQQALRMDSYGKVSAKGSADKMRSLIDNNDVAGLRKYISEITHLNAETIKLKQTFTNTGKPLTQVEAGFRSTGKEAKKMKFTLDDTEQGVHKLRQGFTELDYNANRNLGTFQHFLVSLQRIPAYLASAYLFDGIRRGMKFVLDDILLVDKELVEIQRVISAGINIDQLFQGSVDIANDLGNSIHDVLNATGELARTYGEFNEEQLLAVATTATLMSNVSELGVEESISSLVATMKAFNIEAEDSVRIVDALNEVDNNFAISTTQLSEAMNKSASTAKVFGVSLEENIG